MPGVEAVRPGDNGCEYSLALLLRGSVTAEEGEKPLHKRLLEAALNYLQQAGIYFPHATLEVWGDNVIMHGVPHTGQLLVCAVSDDGIQNYL